jgi:ubiquinone/menaquinone biosynthesis C-methylase UbiE
LAGRSDRNVRRQDKKAIDKPHKIHKNNYHYSDFDKYAEDYDKWFDEHPAIFESELKLLQDMDLSGKILDIGVGTGIFADKIATDKSEIVGVDPSWPMLRVLVEKGRGQRVSFAQAVGEHLPFADGVFDCITMVNTFSYLAKPQVVIEECLRVLRAGGSMVVCEIPAKSPWGIHYRKKKAKEERFYRQSRFYDVSEICNMMESFGTKVIRMSGTLSYDPDKPEITEEPRRWTKEESLGFVCIKAEKLKGD